MEQWIIAENTWYGYKTKYGYFEIRAKLANCGGGGHQAWWMVGMQQDTNDWFNSKQTGEIDILETFFSTPKESCIWLQMIIYLNKLVDNEDAVPQGNPTAEFHFMQWIGHQIEL